MRNGITINGVEHKLSIYPKKKDIPEPSLCSICSLRKECDKLDEAVSLEEQRLCHIVSTWEKKDEKSDYKCYFKKVKHD